MVLQSAFSRPGRWQQIATDKAHLVINHYCSKETKNRTGETGQVNPDPPLVGHSVDTFVGCFVGSP